MTRSPVVAGGAAGAVAAEPRAHRKERGAFFTPPAICAFLAGWALRDPADSVLEPSCGEARFLLAAGARLRELAGSEPGPVKLHGVEVHAPSAREARRLLAAAGLRAGIRVADFLDLEPRPRHDAVVGNPPYLRYQSFRGEARSRALRAARDGGVKLTRLASSWAAFVVHAARFLRPGGRLGLVLPAELLSVNYAAPVRRFLLERFARVRLVLFEDLVFPGVLEEVVLLLAEGEGPADRLEVRRARDLEDVGEAGRGPWERFVPEREGKWTPALLPAGSHAPYGSLVGGGGFVELSAWGQIHLGAVTGNNRYFALTPEDARARCIPPGDLVPISPPGSRHLRGLTYTRAAWRAAGSAGKAAVLFRPRGPRPGAAAQRYVEEGRRAGVHEAYKCRVREPWWSVPLAPVADLLLTYMDRDRPRLIRNAAGVAHLNSLYGLVLARDLRELGRSLLPTAALNSATLLGAELVGRSYGGGLLKIEPGEARRLPVPAPETLRSASDALRALRPRLDRRLRSGELAHAVDLVDGVLLREHLSVERETVASLRRAREALLARRISRGSSFRAARGA